MNSNADDGTAERIAKYLARAGVASRREAEKLIEQGLVTVDGKTLETPAFKVTPEMDIRVDGTRVGKPDAPRLWRYHKPDGLVTTHKDPQGRPTVFEALEGRLPRVISVGRLDLTTEGLLLLTNSGALWPDQPGGARQAEGRRRNRRRSIRPRARRARSDARRQRMDHPRHQ